MTENNALPADWFGKNVHLTTVGIQQDRHATAKLVAVGSDGIRVEQRVEGRDIVQFIPWHAVREVWRAK